MATLLRTLDNGWRHYVINEAAGTSDIDIVSAPGASKGVRLVAGTLFIGAAGDFQLKDSGANVSGVMELSGANTWEIDPGREYQTTVANAALQMSRSASAAVSGEVFAVTFPI